MEDHNYPTEPFPEPKESAWSYQKIVQQACVVSDQQWAHKKYGGLMDLKLRAQLKTQIRQKGGVQAIDAWLKKNEPGHQTLGGIIDMDWSWLT